MTRTRASCATIVLLVAIVLAVPLLSPPALAARFVPCGDISSVGAGVYNVEAKRVGCGHARWVAGRYNDILYGASGSRARIGKFRCRSRQLGIELNRATCTRSGGKVVRFDWGA